MGTLRVIFALSVVFAHSPWNEGLVFVGPRNAVQLFYITSGFLISYVFTERGGYAGVKAFYLSRWLRLYPLYLVVALFTFVIYAGLNPSFFDLYRGLSFSSTTFLSTVNLLLFGQDWAMFAAQRDGALVFASDFTISDFPLWRGLLVPQAWSLGVELCFYAIAPFILFRRNLLVALLIGSLLLRAVLVINGIGKQDPWTYRFFPTELACFIAGALSHQILLPLTRKLLVGIRLPIASIATFAIIILSSLYFVIPVSGAYKAPILFLCFIFFLPLAFIFQSQNNFDRKIGELSYPIYIGHFLIIFLVGIVLKNFNVGSSLLISVANAIFSVIFALFLNRAIGNRIEAFRVSIKS